jgi:hypothetical protein
MHGNWLRRLLDGSSRADLPGFISTLTWLLKYNIRTFFYAEEGISGNSTMCEVNFENYTEVKHPQRRIPFRNLRCLGLSRSQHHPARASPKCDVG